MGRSIEVAGKQMSSVEVDGEGNARSDDKGVVFCLRRGERPRCTRKESSAASDVYKGQATDGGTDGPSSQA